MLDPFCGCGTAVDAAQKLGRRWIGIDITHLAITLIEKRLKDRYPYLNRTKPEKAAAERFGCCRTCAGVHADFRGDRYAGGS